MPISLMPPPPRPKERPRPATPQPHLKDVSNARRPYVDFTAESDLTCVVLGALGMSTRYIRSRTHLTVSQIIYRLSKAKRSLGLESGFRVGFRNGENRFAGMVLSDFESAITKELKGELHNE